MNEIFICGDTHGMLDTKKLDRLKEKINLDYGDYLVICGDSGIVWDKVTVQPHISYFESMNCNVLFVDGNHENFDMLKTYPIQSFSGGKVHKISDCIYHLMRGQVFEILGKTFLCIGGADSSDKECRQSHISWWQDEQITSEDMEQAKQNLEKVNNTVDYVVTHTPSTKTLNELVKILTQCGEVIPYYLRHKVIPTNSSDLLDYVAKNVKYKRWFCGHLHIDEKIGKTNILYEDIIKIN